MKFGKFLGNIAGKLNLYQFLSKIGIEAFFYRRTFKDKISKSKEFYDSNWNRVLSVINMLQDDSSKEIYKRAIQFRMNHKIKNRPPFCNEEEYFNSLIPLQNCKGGVLIDCGAYNGDTIENYKKWTNNSFKKCIAFEPDVANYEILKNNGDAKIVCYNCGVWNTDETLSFSSGKAAGSFVLGKGNISGSNESDNMVKVQVRALDSVPECQDATFIKMDVEGSELMALEGAVKLIKRNRTVLTICIYHTDEDMLTIPEWMINHLTDYVYFVRHHSYYISDTIIYAIPKEQLK